MRGLADQIADGSPEKLLVGAIEQAKAEIAESVRFRPDFSYLHNDWRKGTCSMTASRKFCVRLSSLSARLAVVISWTDGQTGLVAFVGQRA